MWRIFALNAAELQRIQLVLTAMKLSVANVAKQFIAVIATFDTALHAAQTMSQ